jgi:hypothetical protein
LLPGHHVHLPPPPPLIGLLCGFPCSRRVKRTAARWRGASQASCDRLPPADPHRRRPRHPGYWPVLPVAEGLAPSSGSMTTPSTRSRREPGCRHGRQPLHPHAPRPGSTCALARAAWPGRHRPFRRSPTLASIPGAGIELRYRSTGS